MVTRRENVEYIALVSEIFGALAVVISVIYLAVQISDNTIELKSQGHFNALVLAQRPLELVISDRELSAVVNTGYSAPDQLSDADWHRFASHQVLAFNAWEYLYYANETNSVPSNLWVGADAYYRELSCTRPGLAKFWSEYLHVYDEPFRSYVNNSMPMAQTVEWQAAGGVCRHITSGVITTHISHRTD